MRARAADGPYAGQTFEFPRPRIHFPTPNEEAVSELLWIVNGPDRHCYQLAENGYWSSDYRLIYRDTF